MNSLRSGTLRPLAVACVVLCGVVGGVLLGPGAASAAAAKAAEAERSGTESVVLLDGQRIETRAGFEIDGRMVVFTDLGGKLRSIPLRDVDLEASRRSAEEAAEAADSEPNESDSKEIEPVLVLENDDLPSADEAERKRSREAAAERRRVLDQADRRSRVEQGSGGGRRARPRRPSSAAAEGTTAGLATISHWSTAESRQTGGLQIVGSVVNPTGENLDRVTVRLKLYDEEGELVKTGRAFVDRTRLAPGLSTNFRYVDPSLQSLKGLTVEFQVTARALSWGARHKASDDDIPEFRPGDSGS